MSIRKRANIIIGLVVTFILVLTLAANFGIWSMAADVEAMHERNVIPMEYISKISMDYQKSVATLNKAVVALEQDPTAVSSLLSQASQLNQSISQNLTLALVPVKSGVKPTHQGVLSSMTQAQTLYQNTVSGELTQISKLIESGDAQGATLALASAQNGTMAQFEGIMSQAFSNQIDKLAFINSDTQGQAVLLYAGMWLLAVISLIIGYYLAWFLRRRIVLPIVQITDQAREFALGDIHIRFPENLDAEIGQMAESFNSVCDNVIEQASVLQAVAEGNLTVSISPRSDKDDMNRTISVMVEQNKNLISGIIDAAQEVNSNADQMSSAAQALAQVSTEQASSVGTLRASIQEITAKTQENADNTERTASVSTQMLSNVQSGQAQMDRLMHAVQEMQMASENASKIIRVIEDIAFQTNILALNASVEAARAGQHGSGFAVVAEEVRTLAAHSTKAAQESSDMIEDSVQKALESAKIAEEAREALGIIIQGINDSAELVSLITRATQDQVSSLELLNEGVEQVGEIAEHNSASSEETAATSYELLRQAQTLDTITQRYSIHCDAVLENSEQPLRLGQ